MAGKLALDSVTRRPLAMRAAIPAFLYLLMVTGAFGLLPVRKDHILDVQVFVSSGAFFAAVEAQATGCRDCYLAFHVIDLLFLLSFYPLLGTFARRLCHSPAIFVWGAYAAGTMDLLENLGIDTSVVLHPQRYQSLLRLVQVAMPLKFSFLACTLVGMLLCPLIRQVRSRKSG